MLRRHVSRLFFMAEPIEPKGNKKEKELFHEVHKHYVLAKQDLDTRIQRKNGFDDADKMFASHIDEGDWPYSSMMFDARPYTVIVEKSARLIGSRPKGKLVPREGGDSLGAHINNELLDFQWQDNSRIGESMIQKWITMDQNARKYGSSFALVKWRYQTKVVNGKRRVMYDGPDFEVCNSRDVLADPSYSYVKKWFQHREWPTLDELQNINDAARTKPVYKNLDILKDALREEAKAKGDQRSTEYTVQNKSIRGLTDYLGSDEKFKPIEVITEYRSDRWITFAPRYGVLLRDIPNPYDHWEIPVVHLKYYPVQDDLYGIGEFEPVSKMIRGINSLFSQYIDNVTVDLYPPLMVNPVNVRMHTLEFTPEAKWLMNNPGEDVKRLETSTAATNNFQAAYSLMASSLLNAWGETSQGISSINPFEQEKTATEVRDTALQRNVRDNMNQIFLSEALKKQIMFWHSMNQQFLFKGTKDEYKIIRIVGRDAVEFFQKNELDQISPTEDEANQAIFGGEDVLIQGPKYPVEIGEGNVVPKFVPDITGQGGDLYVEEGDIRGDYDYIPDTESMKPPSDQEVEQKLTGILNVITNPTVVQLMAQQGTQPKIRELLIKMFESTNIIKDAEQYFEEGGVANGQINQPGNTNAEAGVPGQGNGIDQGLAGSGEALLGEQDQSLMGGPQG